MKEISPFIVAMEMYKNGISIYSYDHIVKKNSFFMIVRLSEIDRRSVYNSIIGCGADGTTVIACGWNKSNNCVVLDLNSDEKSIRIYEQNDGYLTSCIEILPMQDLRKDDILQLTLTYGISKIELSDELYEFIFEE